MIAITNADPEQLQLAAGDRERATQNGVDLNPFSTSGARALWQAGWDGQQPDLLVRGSGNWRMWERGRLARWLADEPGQVVP